MLNHSHAEGQPRLEALLEQLWISNMGLITTRLSNLERAATLLESNQLDTASRKLATTSAHNLAGVLGTFGLQKGTETALLIEREMELQVNGEAQRVLELRKLVDELGEVIRSRPTSCG